MIVINIHEAKAKLSEYLDLAAGGERVLICKRNQPVAELRAITQARSAPRPIGGGPHQFDVPASFFDPLPDDLMAELESGPIFPEPTSTRAISRVAERRPTYGVRARSKRGPRRS